MKAIDFNAVRKRLHEALEEILADEDDMETVVTGWVLVFEGVHPDDERTLTVLTANATGEERISPWQGEGYLHHVVNNYMDYEFDGDEDGEEADEET